ncbi:hypothetical protein Zmor_015454 [Zophobas morio]|uniref:Peptidase S1 domain-containing protein n=1 Tax=Zophobas morio TaxID=2755281 RepID=A0AA38IJC7_9CUCU|nr:hypothetical protein Zmor_015454 [Zophobas morio]
MCKTILFAVLTLCAFSVWGTPLKVDSRNSARIIGGASARAGQFPFIASIYINRADGTFFCSGALINSQWVLTAGQCVEGATLFTIYLGSNSPRGDSENGVTLATDTYYLHPEYNPATLENDIGLIKFRTYITQTDYIRSINYLASTKLPDYATVATMGWGQTGDDIPGPVDALNYIYLTTLSNVECRLTFGSQITDNMVCVAGSYNQGTCLGDSGSPLIQYGASGNAYHVGISSFYSGNGCETPDPSGFTRTQPYNQWISNTTTFG